MIENLTIQFVYPDYELSQDYEDVINSIDHSIIKPQGCKDADVLVLNSLDNVAIDKPVVWRTTRQELSEKADTVAEVLGKVSRLNIVLTDVSEFSDGDITAYTETLNTLSNKIEQLLVDGKTTQLNVLTDRLMLSQMNNCGAGDTVITLAPNGKFYICPAFYYEDETDSVGDLSEGVNIPNRQLYKLKNAPICRHCDAYQCRRCVWLNRKLTLEVNTPSHQQCIIAHAERNASHLLQNSLRKKGEFLPEIPEIKELTYNDPFDNKNNWK